jgi:hypothetical protein
MALSVSEEAELAELERKAASVNVISSGLTLDEEKEFAQLQAKLTQPSSFDPAELALAYGSEVAIGEASRLGGAALGTAILPGVGTAIGYIVGGLGGGATGSIARQRMLNPDAPLSYGQIVADSLINLIPGGKATKAGRLARIARQSAIGSTISAGAEITEEAIDEGNLPTLEDLQRAGLSGLALGAGLGVTGEAFTKAYSKFGGLPTRNLTEAFKVGDPDAKLLVDGIERTGKEYSEMVSKNFNDLSLGIQEKYSDEKVRALVLQDIVAGGQITNKNAPLKVSNDEMDFYLQRRLAEGKISAKNNELEDLIDLEAGYIIEKAKETGQDASGISRAVNDYLYAKHGIAYNQANKNKFGGDGAAGRSTQEFQESINNFEKAGMDQSFKDIIDSRKALSRRILDTLEDGGLVSKKEATKLRNQFPNYVPLNRVIETDDLAEFANSAVGTAGKYETLSSGIRRAKGSNLEVRDISQNIVDNLVLATRRAEVNKANQAFVKLIRNNKETASLIAEVRKPKIVGTKIVKDMSDEANAFRAAGKKVKSKKVPIYENADRNILTVFEDGKPLFVQIKEPKLAAALKGQNKENISQIMRGLLSMQRFLGGLYTRWSPEFAIPNLLRDRSEALVNNLRIMSVGKALKTFDPISTVSTDMNTIQRNLRGVKATSEQGIAMDKMYKEFVDAGGSTGGLGLSTLKAVEDNITKLGKNLRMPTKSKAKSFTGFVNGFNEVFENATRFATYRRARADGMTAAQSALAARNSSFDPLLQGSQGDTIRALYLFSNPAVQGAKNFLRSMKNFKVGIPVMASLTSTMFLLDQYNKSIDPDYRKKLPKWKLDKHLTIVTEKIVTEENPDGKLEYISIPIGYSMVPFKIAADYLQRALISDEDVGGVNASKDIAKSFIDSYNPMGGSVVPTVLRPMTELSQNKDGLGGDIRPEWLETKNISDVEKIHPWTAKTRGGEFALSLAEQLADMGYETSPENLLYLYQTYTGGPGKTFERLADVTSTLWNNKKLNRNQIPIVRRFFGETYATAFEYRTDEMQLLENIEKVENTSAQKSRRIADRYKSELRDASTRQEKIQILNDVKADPEANESVIKRLDTFIKEDAAGISSKDKRLKGRSVIVRAMFIAERLQNMPREQIPAYLQELQDKKILNDRVARAITEIDSLKGLMAR